MIDSNTRTQYNYESIIRFDLNSFTKEMQIFNNLNTFNDYSLIEELFALSVKYLTVIKYHRK